MEVEDELPSSPTTHDLNFHGSAPCTNWFYSVSAPTSPSHSSELYRSDFDHFSMINQTDDFAFQVSDEDAKCTVSAADLFDGGKIRPLNHRSTFTYGDPDEEVDTTASVRSPLLSFNTSPKFPKSKEKMNWSKGRMTFWNVLTPKRNKQTNPHATLLDDENHGGRGRSLTKSTSNRRGTRSLSPVRLTKSGPWEDDKKKETIKIVQRRSKTSRMSKLKNFLLFRSASEGHASDKVEPLKRFAAFYRRQSESHKNYNSVGAAVSGHERHYAMKKAASKDLKKRTFLPYKSGILGR